MRAQDLTNQQFGELHVIQRDKTRKDRAYWICECSCGKRLSVSGTRLRSGQTSCGCANSRQIKSGQRFGRLIALEPTEQRSNKGNIIWKCQCDCGNIAFVRKDMLLDGKTRSCGCLKKETSLVNLAQSVEDLTQRRFGRLTVIGLDIDLTKQYSRTYWLCQCDCGNTISVRSDHLKNLAIVSCGCAHQSAGEVLVEEYLKQAQICYQKEYKFSDLYDKQPLRFDFALFDTTNSTLVCLIEVDGLQHTQETNYYFSDSLIDRQRRDQLKNHYCIEHNIPLFRIPYNKLSSIHSVYDILQFNFLYKGENE